MKHTPKGKNVLPVYGTYEVLEILKNSNKKGSNEARLAQILKFALNIKNRLENDTWYGNNPLLSWANSFRDQLKQ